MLRRVSTAFWRRIAAFIIRLFLREENVVLPGITVYEDHDKLHRYAELHDNELESRVNSSGVHDCESIDDVLKEACRRLIRLVFKGTEKQINFLSGGAPATAIPLTDRFAAGERS